MELIIFTISLFACTIGGICGLGGGTLLKPIFSLMNIVTTKESTFLCSITVLTMALLSVCFRQKDKLIKYQLSTSLAFGAIIGGLIGKRIFFLSYFFFTDLQIGLIQSIMLVLILIWLIIYNLVLKEKIRTLELKNSILTFIIGLCMGIISTFLGIGGGAINLTILFYFFSMSIQQASINSLYIIVLSQFAGLCEMILLKSIPDFNVSYLIFMLIGACLGSIFSTKLVHRINKDNIKRLFIILLIVAIFICSINIITKI